MRNNREPFILLILASGFLVTAFEVRQLHHIVVSEHWQAQIPIYFCFAAFVASLLALAHHRMLRGLASLVFALGCLIGPFGLYNHSEGDVDRVLQPFLGEAIRAEAKGPRASLQGVQMREDGGEERGERGEAGERGRESGGPPPLAPMSIAGLSAIGLVLAWPEKRKHSG